MNRQGRCCKRLKSGLAGLSWPSWLCLTLCLWGAGEVNAEKVALVIGNQAYHELLPLYTTVNDATAVAEQLTRLGFRVIGLTPNQDGKAALNLDRRDFLRLLNRFRNESKAAEMAFLYYAGHGAIIEGDSYLLPVDVPKPAEKRLLPLMEFDSIALSDALSSLKSVNGPRIAVFDACREIVDYGMHNVFDRIGSDRVKSGLWLPPSPLDSGQIIAFACTAGQFIDNERGKHSPYTQVLLTELNKGQGRDITEFLQTVGAIFGGRNREQLNKQQPEYRSSGVKPNTFFLSGKGGSTCVTNADSEDC